MNEDMQDMFRQMDAMMARLFAGMEAGFHEEMPKGAMGYHIIIHGGNLPTDNGEFSGMPPSRDAKEPVTEVHRIGNEVKVIAGLPGVTEDSLRLDVQGDLLIIDAGDADRHYTTSAHLPPVDAASMQKSLKNGVLEVTFTVIPGNPEQEENGNS
jgi:HSP20 family protein